MRAIPGDGESASFAVFAAFAALVFIRLVVLGDFLLDDASASAVAHYLLKQLAESGKIVGRQVFEIERGLLLDKI